MNLTAYLIGGISLTALGLGAALMWQGNRLEAVREENEKLARSVVSLTVEREQAELARRVARAEASRFRGQAEEYARLRESLLKGENDAPLPDWFAAYLERLLGSAGGGVPGTPN